MGLLADSVRDVKEPLAILLAAVAALLLVSCTNVGGMLLARSASRQRELAIRAALGGSQWRIARQLLVESSLVGLVGGTLGILAALWGVELLIALAPAGTPRLSEVHVDARIAALTFAVSLLVGLLAGVAPAIQTSRPDLAEAMREGGQHASASRRTARVRSLLVVIEVALSLCLVVAAGLLTRSLSRILAAPLGFDPEHVLSIELSFPGLRFNGLKGFSTINSRLVENVSRIPGVESAATTNAVPLTNAGWDFGFLVEGRPPPQPGTEPDTRVNWVSPGFFHTLRIPLIEGRELATTDTYQSQKVMVVNQAFARRFFKGERAVGQRIRMLYSFEDEGQLRLGDRRGDRRRARDRAREGGAAGGVRLADAAGLPGDEPARPHPRRIPRASPVQFARRWRRSIPRRRSARCGAWRTSSPDRWARAASRPCSAARSAHWPCCSRLSASTP